RLLGRFRAFDGAHVVDGDVDALVTEADGDRLSDPRAPPGDDRGLARKAVHRSPSCERCVALLVTPTMAGVTGYGGPAGSAPLDRRAQSLANDARDLAALGVAAEGRLGEDQLAVEGHLEAAVGRRHQLDGLDDRRPPLEQLVR